MSSSIKKFTSRALAPNTLRTYERAFKRLQDWLHSRDLELDDRSLAEYLSDMYESGLSQATCALAVAAARWNISKSGKDLSIGRMTHDVLQGIRRSEKRGTGQVAGLTWEEADKVSRVQQRKKTPAGWRNAAMIAAASDALLRVSEIQAISIDDLNLDVDGEGFSILEIPRSKTDPEGRGEKNYWVPVRRC